jgi:hypothetical protein
MAAKHWAALSRTTTVASGLRLCRGRRGKSLNDAIGAGTLILLLLDSELDPMLMGKGSDMRLTTGKFSEERSQITVDRKTYHDYPTCFLFGHVHWEFDALASESTFAQLIRARWYSVVCTAVKSQVLQVSRPLETCQPPHCDPYRANRLISRSRTQSSTTRAITATRPVIHHSRGHAHPPCPAEATCRRFTHFR